MSERMKVSDVEFREDLYPRFEPDQSRIHSYADAIEQLPPIKVNQANILIDGFHRLKAHQLAEEDTIAREVIDTASEKDLKRMAYRLNSQHGLQLSDEEKKAFAREMIGQIDATALADILSVSKSAVTKWTTRKRRALKEERNRKIQELYLRAWNTQQSIADVLGVAKQTVSNQVDALSNNGTDTEIGQDSRYVYSIWKQRDQDNENADHFGSFPMRYMQNLLHYHTEPLDIVLDPFAGGGTTVDACKSMGRRYFCTDRQVRPGREKDIRQHDIADGLPGYLPASPIKLAFLDPPYWSQAQGRYSEDSSDLGNMSLGDFNAAMQGLFTVLVDRNVQQIAAVIQPTQYSNGFNLVDHVFDFDKMLPAYDIEARYILPYSTQQYNAQMVTKAKRQNKCLVLHRDLIIWRQQ